jgi:hypothetical protein
VACFVLPFLVIWGSVFGSHLLFYWSIAPAALSRWAEANGYRIEQQKAPFLFQGPYAWNAGSFRRVYRVSVRDSNWHLKRGWVRLGQSWWPCLSVEECPIAVQWDSDIITTSASRRPRRSNVSVFWTMRA